MSRARHRRARVVELASWIRAGYKTCGALAAGALAASCLLVASGPAPDASLGAASLSAASSYVNGIDVASFQHPVSSQYPGGAPINWTQVAGAGYQFAAIKATEGNYYVNPYYASDSAAAIAAGMYVAAYEFANPADSTGTAAADYTVQNAGNYQVGGSYLPLMLDLEADPYNSTDGLNACYGLTPAQLLSWITDYINEATARTGAAPVIYTGPTWWANCTGNSTLFGSDVLWLASYSTTPPSTLPGGWANWGFWQYTSQGSVPGITGNVDLDYFSSAPEVERSPVITSTVSQATFNAGAAGNPVTVTAAGFPAPTFAESGALPAGVTLASDGVLSGTPAGNAGGSYPIQVTASNLAGSATQPFTLTVNGGSSYFPVGPVRVLDTRYGTGGFTAPVGPGKAISLQVDGVAGVPASGVTAVVLNVTVTDTTKAGYLAVCPDGQACNASSSSNLNWLAGETIPNLVTVPVGADGKVDFFNAAGSTDVIADLEGYYGSASGGSSYFPAGPQRVLDTRNGTGGFTTPVGPAGLIALPVDGVDGVPASGVSAVVLNVTVTDTTKAGYLAVCPDGQACNAQSSSNLNWTAGETIPNLVTVPVGADGKVDFFNAAGSTDLVADLAGYYSTASGGSQYFPAGPVRVLDTRYGTGGFTSPVGPGNAIALQVAGVDRLPSTGVTAVVMNTTVTDTTAGAYLAVCPDGQTCNAQSSSNLNWTPGETIPNLVVAPVGADGKVDFFNAAGSTDVIADLEGYFTN